MNLANGEIYRIVRFQLVGLMGALVQLGTFALLIHRFGIELSTSTAISVEAAVIHNFAWHERWTWADRISNGETAGRRFKRFCEFNASTGLLSIGLNVPLTYFAIRMIGAPPILANIFAIATAAIFNFLVSERIVFRRAACTSPPPARSNGTDGENLVI